MSKATATEDPLPTVVQTVQKGVATVTLHIGNKSYSDKASDPDQYWYARFLIKAGQEMLTS